MMKAKVWEFRGFHRNCGGRVHLIVYQGKKKLQNFFICTACRQTTVESDIEQTSVFNRLHRGGKHLLERKIVHTEIVQPRPIKGRRKNKLR